MAKIVILRNKQTKFRNYSDPIIPLKVSIEKSYDAVALAKAKGILSMRRTLR